MKIFRQKRKNLFKGDRKCVFGKHRSLFIAENKSVCLMSVGSQHFQSWEGPANVLTVFRQWACTCLELVVLYAHNHLLQWNSWPESFVLFVDIFRDIAYKVNKSINKRKKRNN